MEDTYKTITLASEETLFKDKSSKFFGYAFPVTSEEEIKTCLEVLRKKHNSARHHCYAWRLGTEKFQFRANDDGEPSNTAGQPIYGQIQSFELTNILIVSVRYFGGVKLGVGGLINAYKNSAKLAIEASEIVKKTINLQLELRFSYELMNKVQRVIKERKLNVLKQTLELDCHYVISIRKKDFKIVFDVFDSIYKIDVKEVYGSN